VEFDGAWARRIGEEGRGVATIIEMVHHTRLDCVMGAASLMRQALAQAVHHARHRRAFGKLLIDQPLMRNVLADLALESEAATLLLMRIARAFDEGDRAFARLAVAAGKYWVAKRTPAHVAEALECLGGNGYVEESPMPRLYREAPLNSIWEGSGNVIALDVMRAIKKEPEALERVRQEIALAGDARLKGLAIDPNVSEEEARGLAQRIAVGLQASLMLRFSPGGDLFCASRIETSAGRVFGTLPAGSDLNSILNS
jgi:putative acyl-CoA dehydrogenase